MASAKEISSGNAGYSPMAGPITVYFRNRLNVKKLAIINTTASGSAVPAPADYARGLRLRLRIGFRLLKVFFERNYLPSRASRRTRNRCAETLSLIIGSSSLTRTLYLLTIPDRHSGKLGRPFVGTGE